MSSCRSPRAPTHSRAVAKTTDEAGKHHHAATTSCPLEGWRTAARPEEAKVESCQWHQAADFMEKAPNGRDLSFDVELQRALRAGQMMSAEDIQEASKAATTVPPTLEQLGDMRKFYAKKI